jgi:GntR family transcriptional regulator, transcriptional repressor for pyruvate dehydrogenase complex
VVREAVRALAAKGIIQVRTGSGLCGAAVDASAVSESIYLRGGSLEYPKVHEVRKLLEIEIAGLSAEKAGGEQVRSMHQICARMEKEVARRAIGAASQLDVEFHRELARSTDNALYLLLLDSIGEALLDVRRDNLRKATAAEDALHLHREILAGVEPHDRDAACDAMHRHLDNVEEHWLGSHSAAAVPG